MKARRFFVVTMAAILLCLACVAGYVIWAQPTVIAGKLEESDTGLFVNERYEMAGLIRNQDYSAVLMGTSLTANYRASWFAGETGKTTLKVTFPDGWISEFDTALELVWDTHPEVDTVFFCMDPNIMIRSDSQRTVELPRYLYNRNPLDDIEFYLNADALLMAAETVEARKNNTAVDLDSAYVWDERTVFSAEEALKYYQRPPVGGTTLPGDAYLAAVEENLDVVCGWAEEHPDVKFVIWFPPYSILYWDKMTREGTADAIITAVERAAYRLMEHENVSVHCFLHNYPVIQNLENYADHIHCSGFITYDTAQHLLAGRWKFNGENCKMRLDELREFVASYDYESLFDS